MDVNECPAKKRFDRCCVKSEHHDLSNGIGKERHLICGRCFSHLYKGRYWNAKEWEEWVKG